MPPFPAKRRKNPSRKPNNNAGSLRFLTGLKNAELYSQIALKSQTAVQALSNAISERMRSSGESFETARKNVFAEITAELHSLKARIRTAEGEGKGRRFQRIVWDLKLAINEIEKKGKNFS